MYSLLLLYIAGQNRIIPLMKKAIIFHGTDENPQKYWYPWLAGRLETRGYEVQVPHYPELNRAPIAEFIGTVLGRHTFDDETTLVGHSAGAPLLLSILERIDVVVPQAILVAGFTEPLGPDASDPILQDTYNWEKIKANAEDIYFINSTNDPWGCDDKQGRIMLEHLGGTQIVRKEGHFGSGTYGQPYPAFELVDRLIP